MGDTPDFVQRFHNLEGDLITTRKKNLYKLLKTHSLTQNEEQLNATLKNLKPTTFQEHIFYIDTLIYFKRTEILLELLKNGNDLYSSKILKQNWFFEAAFKDIDPEKLVNEFLPYLSYSVRKKFLNKILKSLTAEKTDILFEELDKKYGLTVAIPVLHKCTLSKIKTVLENNEIKLRPNQVMQLINISNDLFIVYLDYINELTHSRYDENKVLNYLATKNINFYIEIKKMNKIGQHQLSRRLTKKCVPVIKEDLLTDSEHYFRILNKPAAVRKLGYDFKTIFENIFPKHFKNINSYNSSIQLLDFCPKRRRWNLFLQTCNDKFPEKNIDQILLLFSSQIKKLNPPNELFLKWAQLNYDKQEGYFVDYLKYYNPSVAIPIIKEKINLTKDISSRGDLICIMIKSCSEHNDLSALEQVLQYLCFRHRNEDAFFRNNILKEISKRFKLEELNENHWKYINEQIKILKIQKEFSFFTNTDFIEKHLEFLFKNKKQYKEALKEYVSELVEYRTQRLLDLQNKSVAKEIYTEIGKLVTENDSSNQFIILTLILIFSINNPDYCINLAGYPIFIDCIQKMFAQNELSPNEKKLTSLVIDYNLTFPNYSIPIEDSKMLNIISIIIKTDRSLRHFSNVFQKFVLKINRSNFENSLLEFYLDKLSEDYPLWETINWLLRNQPLIILPYFDKILQTTTEMNNNIDFKIVRNYSHLKLDQKVVKLYNSKLNKDDIHDKRKLIRSLCILLPTDDFRKIVEDNYLPTKDKLDMEDPKMLEIYKLQCDVVKILSGVSETYKVLPTIMKFCKGDYLQSALKSLYKAFYKSPERILYSYVEVLSKMAVSVRKHAIYLSCEVLDKEHAKNILKNTTEGNVSSQKHLFSSTLKYFLKNPSDDLLERLIECMDSIDKNDTETLDSLKNVNVPLKYRSKYLEHCWIFFENMESSGVKVKVYLEQLLNKMRGDILLSLNATFVTNLIKNYCFMESLEGTDKFAIEVLKTCISERTEYFLLIFDKLFKSNFSIVTKFFDCFIHLFAESGIDKNLPLLFSQYWNKYFPQIIYLNQQIELNLYIMRLSTDNYAISVINYMEKLISDLGHHVFKHFKHKLKSVLWTMTPIEHYNLLLDIVKYKLDVNTCILVLELLEDRGDDSEKLICNNIMEILKNVEIPIVVFYRNYYLANNS